MRRRLNRLAVTSARCRSKRGLFCMAIVTHNDFDCACEMNFLTKKSKNKRTEGKRKENLRGAEENKTRKRKKNSGKKKKFFQETIGRTRVYLIVERARSRYSVLVLIILWLKSGRRPDWIRVTSAVRPLELCIEGRTRVTSCPGAWHLFRGWFGHGRALSRWHRLGLTVV